jgi:hypothetical protein
MVDLNLNSQKNCLHGAVLNWLSTMTTLHLQQEQLYFTCTGKQKGKSVPMLS